ncbi:diguanylate cyclase domain-containing protein [Rhodoferax sp.]|uniref:diguanylate cyclase domain-containing protein n=1 Tax=Rhodoferax sp. TaxID=50421 RepID=UPI00374CD103
MLTRSSLPADTEYGTDTMRNWFYVGIAAPRSGSSRSRPGSHTNEAGPREGSLQQARKLEELVAQRTAELEQVIAQLRARQMQLEAQVHHDFLTGLANRKLLQDRFQCAMERAKRSGECFAVLMIDLDGFKTINDTYGHAAGDTVLITVARRMLATVRNCDTVARLGGDEFVLIVEAIHDAQEVASISRKLMRTLSAQIHLDCGTMVSIGASMGLALYPSDGLDLAHVLSAADQAMYSCKNTNRMRL